MTSYYTRHLHQFNRVAAFIEEKETMGILSLSNSQFERKQDGPIAFWYEGYLGVQTTSTYYKKLLCPSLAQWCCRLQLYPLASTLLGNIFVPEWPHYYSIVLRSYEDAGRRPICKADIPAITENLQGCHGLEGGW